MLNCRSNEARPQRSATLSQHPVIRFSRTRSKNDRFRSRSDEPSECFARPTEDGACSIATAVRTGWIPEGPAHRVDDRGNDLWTWMSCGVVVQENLGHGIKREQLKSERGGELVYHVAGNNHALGRNARFRNGGENASPHIRDINGHLYAAGVRRGR